MNGIILSEELTRETYLYRTIQKERLLQIFANRQNVLVRPKMWDDPYENLALQSLAELGHEVATFGFQDDVYGQCWTLESFSDAMWRIYSDGTDGYRIRTTVGKLLDSLAVSNQKFANISCFIGKVRYCSDESLVEFSQEHFAEGIGNDGIKIAETLLLKRKAFRHENEVRLIYLSPTAQPAEEDLYKYAFDPYAMIDQIMLHPQLTPNEAENVKEEIRLKANWNGEIKHSLLYRLPKGFRFRVGK